jgi:hypothetical protein
MDGTGESGLILDLTKTQILVISFQALYVGRVMVGFDIGGQIVYVHQFNCANVLAFPYAQSMNLPVQCGMTCSGTVTTTMRFVCASVISEGGDLDPAGVKVSQPSPTITAGSGTRTHIMSFRPKTTFNGIPNRTNFELANVDGLVTTGSNPIYWELCIGQAITGTAAYQNVNTAYSAIEYTPTGTVTGPPALVLTSGYINAAAQARGQISKDLGVRQPLSLNASGQTRLLGTMSLVVTGIGGTSPVQFALNWKEIR